MTEAQDSTAPPRVAMRGVSKRYGIAYALHDVDFQARPGEIHALVGENGAGKSTLVRILAGVVAGDEGSMEVDGASYAPRSPHDARSLGIRAVHQEFSLVAHLSVAENLLLGEMPTRAPGIIDWRAAHRAAGNQQRAHNAASAARGRPSRPVEQGPAAR